MRQTHLFRCVVGVLIAAVAFVSAQAQSGLGEHRRQMTRAELENMLASYDKLAVSTKDKKVKEQAMSEAAAIRERLRTGDFYPGDRIVVHVLNDTSLSDTFTVKQGRILDFGTIPAASLSGVLDSELLLTLKGHIAKFIRDPDVTATPLVRLQMSGGIAQPGWYQFETDQTLSDAIMSIGGPGANAEINKAEIKRGGKTLVDRGATARALRSGKTIGDLGLRDGDELYVAERAVAQSGRLWAILPLVTSVLFAVRWITVRN
ncbi:MAG: polysaccharide biosynthesis/export family protein [Gemmatimonadaceae bacterium]